MNISKADLVEEVSIDLFTDFWPMDHQLSPIFYSTAGYNGLACSPSSTGPWLMICCMVDDINRLVEGTIIKLQTVSVVLEFVFLRNNINVYNYNI